MKSDSDWIMQGEMPKKPKRTNEARKNLVEIKRPVKKADGSTFRKSFYGRTKEEAERKYRDELNPPLQTAVPEGSFAWWLLNKYVPLKSHLRTNSRNNIQAAVRHLLPDLGHRQIKDLDAAELAMALARIAEKKTCRNKNATAKPKKMADGTVVWVEPVRILKPLGPSTVNRCRRIALETIEIASEIDHSVRRVNPRRVPTMEEELKEVDVYTPAEMRRLLEVSRGSIAFVPVLLYGFLGLRLREALGTYASDLMPDGVLEVTRQLARNGQTTAKLKTGYSRRDMPLPAGLWEELQPFAFGGEAPLCRNTDGNFLSADNLVRSLEGKMRRAGLRLLTRHDLRHSFSTWLDENGCPRSVRLALMGQSRREVADRYNHPSPEKLREWLGKLWEASFEPDTGVVVNYEFGKSGPRIPASGESNGRSKLKAADVVTIKARLADGETAYAIAKDYAVDPRAIRNIADGKTWKDVA